MGIFGKKKQQPAPVAPAPVAPAPAVKKRTAKQAYADAGIDWSLNGEDFHTFTTGHFDVNADVCAMLDQGKNTVFAVRLILGETNGRSGYILVAEGQQVAFLDRTSVLTRWYNQQPPDAAMAIARMWWWDGPNAAGTGNWCIECSLPKKRSTT